MNRGRGPDRDPAIARSTDTALRPQAGTDPNFSPYAVVNVPTGRRAARAARLRRLRALGGAVLGGAGLALALALWLPDEDAARLRATAAWLADPDSLARLAGFGIDEVAVTGQRFTHDGDIFDALDLANASSLASFDAAAVKERLERLPWIARADITRVYPDRLDVRVTERKPYAVWVRGDLHYLIDDQGRVLSATPPGSRSDLPRLSGEGAASEGRQMIELLALYPEISRLVIELERVGERRWTLHLARGLDVNLPPDREAASLALISSGGEFAGLLAGEHCSIDLRAADRVSFRAKSDPSAARGPGKCGAAG